MQMIIIVGNLTKDAETRTTNRNGQNIEFVSFTVACNEQVGETRNTTYYEVTYQKTGNYPYLKKGQSVTVLGRFRPSVTKTQDGKEFHHYNVSAVSVELTGRKEQESQHQPQPGEW